MDGLASLWERLLHHQRHTLFQRFSWNRLAAEVFADRLTPHVICVESDAGAAIIPAAINKATGDIELLGETLFDYRDVLHCGDKQVLLEGWRTLTNHRKALNVIAVDDMAAVERWDDFSLMPFAAAPGVDRSLIDERAFRLAHARLGRQIRRLERLGVTFHTSSGSDVDLVRRIYNAKRVQVTADGHSNLFLDPVRCDFMNAVAAMEGERCRVYTLRKQSELVAALVGFDDSGVRRFYTTYFDPAWAGYSPGQALLYEATAQSLAEGFSCDYMTGEYPYKLRLANTSRQLFRVDRSAEQLAEISTRPPASRAA